MGRGTQYAPLVREALTGLSREEARARYEALALPTTSDESWRFTDLAGFDPDSFSRDAASAVPPTESVLDIDAAGIAIVTESGIRIEREPEGVIFAPLGGHPDLGALVGTDEKFAAHNAAVWKHGLLVVVPRGVELEQPLAVRIVNSADGGALFSRLLVIAEPESRFTLIEEYVSASP